MGQQALARTLGLNDMTVYQTRHSGASIDRLRGFRTLREVQRRGQWKAYCKRYTYRAHVFLMHSLSACLFQLVVAVVQSCCH